jgi:hypothetical protein
VSYLAISAMEAMKCTIMTYFFSEEGQGSSVEAVGSRVKGVGSRMAAEAGRSRRRVLS